jgi:hypothetical protein
VYGMPRRLAPRHGAARRAPRCYLVTRYIAYALVLSQAIRYDGSMATETLASEVAREARGWLEDCGLDTRGMDATRVIRTVHWNVEGGWPGFVALDPTWEPARVHDALAQAHGLAFARELQRP